MPGYVTLHSFDSSGNEITDPSGNPAGNTVAHILSSIYGSYPEYLYDDSTATNASAVDNAAFNAIDASSYEGVVFMNTTGNVSVQVSIDGTNYIDYPFTDLGAVDATAEARVLVTGTTTNTGPYLVETPFKSIQFLNEGAVAAVITFARVGKIGVIK